MLAYNFFRISERDVIAQSRTQNLINGADNAGFANWVSSNKDDWATIAYKTDSDMVVFGEWCGKGIQSKVAISNIDKKVFAIFSARYIDPNKDDFLVEPEDLLKLSSVKDTYVLPWYGPSIDIDWSASAEELTRITARINEWVSEVEKEDPWVLSTFGIKGTGEGLVFYPVSREHLGLKSFNNLVFKAKGEAHKNIKSAAPTQVAAEAAANIEQFADMVLSEARLEQGAAGSYDMKAIGKFLSWIAGDVQKECSDELEVSGLTWQQVSKAVSTKARMWYIEKSKVL